MKTLTRIIFCTFVISILFSCEPEELSSEFTSEPTCVEQIKPFGDTGGNENDVEDNKKT